MALAEERQHVMLAEAVEIDVLHDDHFAIVHREQRIVEDRIDIGVVAAGEELQRFLDALRSPDEPLSSRVLAELDQELPNEILHGSILSCVPFLNPRGAKDIGQTVVALVARVLVNRSLDSTHRDLT